MSRLLPRATSMTCEPNLPSACAIPKQYQAWSSEPGALLSSLVYSGLQVRGL